MKLINNRLVETADAILEIRDIGQGPAVVLIPSWARDINDYNDLANGSHWGGVSVRIN